MERKRIAVLLLAAGIGGCGYDPAADTVQRDVYTRLEDCVADWGNQELCAQTLQAENQQEQRDASGNVVMVPQYVFHGPAYYPGNRSVTYSGRTVTPTGVGRPVSVSSFSRSGISPSAARGGFGSAGHAVASAGHGSSAGG